MKAILRNKLTGATIPVTSTTVHPDCSYGQAVWVDADNQSYCIVGLPHPVYEIVSATIDDRETLGQVLKSLRLQKGISIRDLADMCGLSKSTVVNVEAGRFSPTIDVVNKILGALGASMTIQM